MGLGDITYSCNVISPSDTGGVMARWIRFRGRYDRYGWDKFVMRGIKKVERGMI